MRDVIRNLPEKWDLETDVVSVGSGGGGLAAAITAHDHGASAIVLERSDRVGGVTAYSMGEVWIPGNHLADVRLVLKTVDDALIGIAYRGIRHGHQVRLDQSNSCDRDRLSRC